MLMLPQTTPQWTVCGTQGFHNLVYEPSGPIAELGDHDCLIEIEAVSLNFRDTLVPQGKYPFKLNLPRVPCCDGSGTVLSTGSKVSRFTAGDKVCTQFYQNFQSGPPRKEAIAAALGSTLDGTLRRYAVFPETGLVRAPESIDLLTAAALSCASLTAWNALFGGHQDSILSPNDVVLIQGSGGVSLAALQFAVAAGATVIATTSSPEKCARLQSLGASEVINSSEVRNWGALAKELATSKNGRGVDHIIDVGGPASMAQSLAAIAIGGVINVIGFLGGRECLDQPSLLEALLHMCTIRGIVVGSTQQFEQMNAFIDEKGLQPIIDPKTFRMDEVRQAFAYMSKQQNFGKVVIRVRDPHS